MTTERTSGILLHPSSLPGPYGAGDFGPDAYRFVDWLASAGQSLWQVLPLGALGMGNSPYMGSSAFAGNPLLIDLTDLGERGWLSADELKPDPSFHADRVDFAGQYAYRIPRLRIAAKRFFAAPSSADKHDYEAFLTAEASWLDDYALFMAIETGHPGQAWHQWPAPLVRRDPKALREITDKLAGEIAFWNFCQWRFSRQWADLKAYANEHGVRVVGDVPIFVAQHSADVWAHQGLFDLEPNGLPRVVAGVPPDYFSATGQRWGNPLFKWDAHERDGFAWWRARMARALALADLVRIDHFRGFAAYWEIPAAEPNAINGRWVPGPGKALFQALRDHFPELPIIAEDLGVITPDVEALRDDFGLPGMRIVQFAFSENAHHPYLPHNFIANTIAYTGTHDNNTILGWWQAATPYERAFARHYLGSNGHDIHWALIRALSASVARTVIIPMQDILALDESQRMNVPGQPEGNWEWRFTWPQVEFWHASVLREMAAVHGRTAFEGVNLAG